MAANNEKPVTFGATIVDPAAPSPALRPAPSTESNLSAPSVAEKDVHIDSSNPFSAFYKHPEARRSMDGVAPLKTNLNVGVYERDLEAGMPLSAATTQQPKVSVDGRVKECTMWPSRQDMIEKKKQRRRNKGCNLFKGMSPKQRLWIKILIALVVIGAAVGLGVGVSRAVGGGVWSGNGHNRQIPSDNHN